MDASTKHNSPELRVFKLYFSKLVESISHPEHLANELYSHDVISKGVRDDTHTMGPSAYYRASKLVAAVESQIVLSPLILHTFLSVVRGDPSLVYIADAISDHYRTLLPSKVANTRLPTLSQISAELRDFENWYLLGLQLNIGKDTLDSIEKTHDTRVRQCIEMIQHWIKNTKNPTWEAIHEALRNICESALAAKIVDKYHVQCSHTTEEKPELPNSLSTNNEMLLVHVKSSRSSSSGEKESAAAIVKPRKLITREEWRISSCFATVLDRIRKLLEELVNPSDLVCFLRLHCHPLDPEKLYIDRKILQNDSSVSEVLESLVPDYINYMETGLLEAIVERFECKEGQILLQQYHDCYPINRLIRDMPDPVSDERLDLTRRKRLRAKCDADFDSVRAADVKRIRRVIEHATGIDYRLVTPAQHSEGSLYLTFLIPESVIGIFQELCDEDLEILAEAGMVEIRIEDFVICDIHKLYPQVTGCSTRSTSVPDARQIETAKGLDTYMQQREEQFTSKEMDQVKGLYKSIPKSRLEELCSDSYLQQLAAHMREWKKLAPYLGITELEMMKLHYYPNVVEQSYRALLCWKQINPESATYKNLCRCFLVHAPFALAETALKMLTPDAGVQETSKLLQKAYLSKNSQPLWTGAPELLQFGQNLRRVTKDTDKQLQNIDYSSRFETLEHFSSKIETVSVKSFVNAITKKKSRFFLIKGPPGSGRTTLLQRVCAFWAGGFCLRKFNLVLWLDLKAHPSAPSNVSLRMLLNFTLPCGSCLDSVWWWLCRHNAHDVLLVIDGVEGRACSEWKRFLDAVLTMNKLNKASVILTAASEIQIKDLTTSLYCCQYVNFCQYDVLGLSQNQISKQIIHHYHHDSSKAEEFLVYIAESHDIRTLCSIPPYLAAVLFVFDRVSNKDLPSTWTLLFTSLTRCLLPLLTVSDCDLPIILASKAYSVTNTNFTLEWHHSYTDICTRVTPPYQNMVTAATHCCFTLSLIRDYLCAQHIHSLPLDQHLQALNKETTPVKRFYVGLCSSCERVDSVLKTQDILLYSACISEVAVDLLQGLMISQLTFRKQWLTSFDIHHVLHAVQYSKTLHTLEFSSCHFEFEMMVKWLRAYSVLHIDCPVRELILRNNHISNKEACALAEVLQVNQSLQKLDLGRNWISAVGAYALARVLQLNQNLQELNLGWNNISNRGACALADALQENQSLQKLNLWFNNISGEGICELAAALKVNQCLRNLNLSSNVISNKGARALAGALQVNQSLQKLDLGLNKILSDGACALAGALQVNQCLKKLNLGDNKIYNKGALAVARALEVNQSLQKLDLGQNMISDIGAYALANGVQKNKSLRKLILWRNDIKYRGACALAGALKVNQSLQILILLGNMISDEGTCALAEALKINQILQKLDLYGNHLSDKGACALAGALQVNQSLQELDLEHNMISNEGACALAGALQVNQSLQQLNVSSNYICCHGRSNLRQAELKRKNFEILGLDYQKL